MKPKHKRLVLVVLSLAVMGGAAAAVLTSFRDSLVFFYTPTQWQEKLQAGNTPTTAELRIGGLVKEGSVITADDGTMRFIITDLTHELPVRYRGMVPALFREGQGVVAQGRIGANGTLDARTILAKHDENYMPREVVEALKKSGRWQHTE